MNNEEKNRELSGLAWDLKQLNDEQRRLSMRLEKVTNQVRDIVSFQDDELSEGVFVPKEYGAQLPEMSDRQTASVPVKPPPIPSFLPKGKTHSIAPPVMRRETPRSELLETTITKLKKIWSWLLVGEEKKPSDVTAEYAIATTWLMRVGIVILVTGIGFFLKWSFDNNIIGPMGRVAIAMSAGIFMVCWGMKLLGKKYHILGQGFLGGGFLTLYFSVYSAGIIYNLIPISMAFTLMILVTLVAGSIAVKVDSLLIAIIGIAGGYVTPILLAPAVTSLPVLYSYILLLGVGILGIAKYKKWYLLNYLGFVCTYILFFRSLWEYRLADFPVAITFLSIFFVIHSMIAYIHNVIKKSPSTSLEIVHLVANAVIFSGTSYHLIMGAYGGKYPAIMTLALASFYLIHLFFFIKRRNVNRNMQVTLIALAAAFTGLTLPIIFEKESLTIAVSLLAFIFLWVGRKVRSNFLENLAYLLYMIVFVRILGMDMRNNFDVRPDRALPMAEYWGQMLDRLWIFGVSIGSIAGAFFLQRLRMENTDDPVVLPANDTVRLLDRNVSTTIFHWLAILFGFWFVYLETNTMFVYFELLRLPVLTVLWCVMAGYFLWRYVATGCRSKAMFVAMCIFMIVAVVKLFVFDLASWSFGGSLLYDIPYHFMDASLRFMGFGSLLACILVIWLVLKRNRLEETRTISHAFGYSALVLFFLYATFEINSLLFWCLPDFQAGGISVLWATFAIAFVSVGIWKTVRTLRYAGLILFAIVAGKIIFWDMEDMLVIYKVLAFMGVGITLLLGSFAYLYASKKFKIDTVSSG